MLLSLIPHLALVASNLQLYCHFLDSEQKNHQQEVKIFNSGIIQGDHDGAVWWDFVVDDPYQQEQGFELCDSLPCVSSTFLENSGGAPPPPAYDLFNKTHFGQLLYFTSA